MASTSPLTILVTGATGSQGGATIRHLLSQSPQPRIHALVRDPSSPAARSLSSLGCHLFRGDFSEPSSLAAAAHNCTSVFINTFPHPTPGVEIQHASNIVSAAVASKSVTHLIYSSVMLTGQHGTFPNFDPGSFMGTYWLSKHGIEELVRGSGLGYTILRPSFLMKNLVPPGSDFNFPTLGKEGVFKTAYRRGTKLQLLSENDVGVFAGLAFLEPDRFNGREITLGAQLLGLDEIVAELSRAVGKEVKLEFYDDEELKGMGGQNPIVNSQILSSELDFTLDAQALRKEFRVELVSFREYLEMKKEDVKTAFVF